MIPPNVKCPWHHSVLCFIEAIKRGNACQVLTLVRQKFLWVPVELYTGQITSCAFLQQVCSLYSHVKLTQDPITQETQASNENLRPGGRYES